MNVEGGEAECVFDFSGEMQRPAQGKITIPQGSLEMHVPAVTAARISAETLTGSVNLGEGFTKKAGAFWNQAALAVQEPILKLRASVLEGAIRLRSS
jgi:hypothetical protein